MKTAYRGDGEIERDAINVLDCVYCGAWFPTFERLAKHVSLQHDPLMIKRPLHERTRPMAKAAKTRPSFKKVSAKKKTAAKSGRIPAPSGDAQSSFSPFLKAETIGGEGDAASIKLVGDARLVDGAFGEQIVIPVKVNGKSFDWAIGVDSVNHRLLHERFGANSARWRGTVRVVIKESRQGRDYIAVER
ncbi:MAG TPA: hypothetical protein VJ842_14385 [Pyrinomonadaceae bacterium]|nr:hypothetical protein [Pyrinomonadaceae bacterium]